MIFQDLRVIIYIGENFGGGFLYTKFVHTLYYLSIIAQSVFSLLFPVGLLTWLSWLLTSKGYTGEWIYAVLILLGFAIGLFSMFRFITAATRQVRALEKEAEEKQRAAHTSQQIKTNEREDNK